MALDYDAPCGIRPRIILAASWILSTDDLAELLGVTTDIVWAILDDDTYEPDELTLATLNENLYLVTRELPHERGLTAATRERIRVYESELWNDAQLAALTFPPNTEFFTAIFCGGSNTSGPSTSDHYGPDDFSPAEVADIVVGADLERLIAFRTYLV